MDEKEVDKKVKELAAELGKDLKDHINKCLEAHVERCKAAILGKKKDSGFLD